MYLEIISKFLIIGFTSITSANNYPVDGIRCLFKDMSYKWNQGPGICRPLRNYYGHRKLLYRTHIFVCAVNNQSLMGLKKVVLRNQMISQNYFFYASWDFFPDSPKNHEFVLLQVENTTTVVVLTTVTSKVTPTNIQRSVSQNRCDVRDGACPRTVWPTLRTDFD